MGGMEGSVSWHGVKEVYQGVGIFIIGSSVDVLGVETHSNPDGYAEIYEFNVSSICVCTM